MASRGKVEDEAADEMYVSKGFAPDRRGPRTRGLLLLGLISIATASCQRPQRRAAAAPHVELVPAAAGPVDLVVRNALADARAEGRRLVVYVSASWCEPCERFQSAVRAGRLDTSFPDLRLLVFDHDRDVGRLAAAGYDGRMIPRFVVPGPDGRATDQRVEGGTKATDTVATTIAPRLARLLGVSLPPPPPAAP
jgi:hypothetical protein